MKQTLGLGLIAFLVAIGGGTWFATSFAPSPPRSTSTIGALTPGTSAPTGLESMGDKPDGQAKGAGKGKPPKPASPAAPAQEPAKPADSTAAPKAPSRPPVDSATLARSAKSVAKVLASMKPKEAVGILGKLSDDEVERIVRQLNPKQVAALLAAFPQERAAGLSRKLLGPRA